MKSFLITAGTLIGIIALNIAYRCIPYFKLSFDTFFITILILSTYFIPTLISKIRKSYNQKNILIINIFLGWTLIGWVIALIMARSSNTNEIKENNSSRKTIITHDDILDLVILLNSPITWEQFMKTI